jgi:hypothetical protein
MTRVCKYRMLVQARTDLTPDEIAKYEASNTANGHGPTTWPWRETGEIIHARRARTACMFYRALKQIKPIIKIRALRLPLIKSERLMDDELMRAWRGFECLCGYIAHGGVEAADEVKHFEVSNGVTACGLSFTGHWKLRGKPNATNA